jgi:DNA-binding MarR family transcriptional regulator
VRRTPDPHDARAVVLAATPRGRRLMERGRRHRTERLVAELRALSAADVATLTRAARILRSLE